MCCEHKGNDILHIFALSVGDVSGLDDQKNQVSEAVPLSISTEAPGNPTMVFFTMDYGESIALVGIFCLNTKRITI